jgi:hypothetical protein
LDYIQMRELKFQNEDIIADRNIPINLHFLYKNYTKYELNIIGGYNFALLG